MKDELLAHSTENKAQKAKLEENMVTLRAEKDCAEKHVRDVDKREESFLKERDDLLEIPLRKELRKKRKLLSSMTK